MEKLTKQEEEAMQAVWKTGEGNVKVFLDNMDEPRTPYTTLASTIKNLEKKGYLRSKVERTGRTFRRMYRATALGRKASKAARTKVRELFGELVEGV